MKEIQQIQKMYWEVDDDYEHETQLVAVVPECTRSSSKVNHFQIINCD